jgi:hypothetical protein
VKKRSLLLFLAFGFIIIFFGSCTKLNEATEIGGNLIPTVDNITTFDTTISINSTYAPLSDTGRFYYNDLAAIGKMNDPVFGGTSANAYFNVSSPSYGVMPFQGTNQIVDSVVLSLSYHSSYGDSAAGNFQTYNVYEIDHNSNFRSDTTYQFTQPDFANTGTLLGSRTFTPASLNDSIHVDGDSTGINQVLRIQLSRSFGQRFISAPGYDTASGNAYSSDSIFHADFFKGLTIKAGGFSGGNGALSYFRLSDPSKTFMKIYYHATIGGVSDSATSITFVHSSNGQADIVQRQPGGDYASYLAAGNSPDGRVFLQSAPGSYVKLQIPGLGAFSNVNRLIHRAELIIPKVPSTADNIFTSPDQLMLDAYKQAPDTAFLLSKDLMLNSDGSVNFTSFGGKLQLDNSYRFTITRYIQGLVTEKNPNYMLRLYAPFRTDLYVGTTPYLISVNSRLASGRAVLAGGNYTDPNQRMRLHIIYSKL